MKKIRHILNTIVWTVFCAYLLLSVLMQIPAVQRYTAHCVAEALQEKFGTKVNIGSINLGFFNRLIVDGFTMQDHNGKQMLRAARLSVSVSLLELTKGNIEISSAQIFGLKANAYKETEQSQPNYQFLIDSLSSKEKSESSFRLRISSFIIRHGEVSYNQLDKPVAAGKLSPYHINVSEISSHIIIRNISNDNISATVKKFSFREASGLDVKELTFSLEADTKKAKLEKFTLRLPETMISSDSIAASYKVSDGKLYTGSLAFSGGINGKDITLRDFAFLYPPLRDIDCKLKLETIFSCSNNILSISNLSLHSTDNDLRLFASAYMPISGTSEWGGTLSELHIGERTAAIARKILTKQKITLPKLTDNVKWLNLKGNVSGRGKNFKTNAMLDTNLGNVAAEVGKRGENITVNLKTEQFNLCDLLSNEKLGTVSLSLHSTATLRDGKPVSAAVNGEVQQLDYNGYSYNNIQLAADYRTDALKANVNINDTYCNVSLNGTVSSLRTTPHTTLSAVISRLNPQRLDISNKWGDTDFSLGLNADVNGKDLHTLSGNVNVTNFRMISATDDYTIHRIDAEVKPTHIGIDSDFGTIDLNGKYNFATIQTSILSIVKSKLPTMPWLGKVDKTKSIGNNFALSADIHDTRWLNKLFGIPYEANQPISINACLNSNAGLLDAQVEMPQFTVDGAEYSNGTLSVHTLNDTLFADVAVKKLLGNGNDVTLHLAANAADNMLGSIVDVDYNAPVRVKGSLCANTQFFNTMGGGKSVMFNLEPSTILINDTAWTVSPSSILYNGRDVQVNNFAVAHGSQYLKVNGKANRDQSDSICVDLKDIDVNYVLNIVNFHSVTFSGLASGKAYVKSVLGRPDAYANLTVDKFHFQEGRMGTLYANIAWNNAAKQIDIDAHADEGDTARTLINGYVSLARNYIDLGINAHNTNAEFLESFCDSFMSDINVRATGFAQVYGDLSAINMRGKLVADGTAHITSLNTDYTLQNDTVLMVPNEIIFNGDTVRDCNGNVAIVTGALHHRNLSHLTYDIDVDAHNFLCYDFRNYGDMNFFGTVFATGKCVITGRPHNITFDIDMKPEKGSFIEYNASSPDDVNDGTFLTWVDHTTADSVATEAELHAKANGTTDLNDGSDMHINFDVDCTPDFTLRVLMDEATGDKISLCGTGGIKATYFNKGSFDMFGTYLIDHGSYNLTIQNVIRKDFHFEQGSYIVFGGNPFNALLNLKAVYPVNGVSLADLRIGNSFSSNNVRVDCIMNITGTPENIRVDFDFDMPTVNNDAKQMVRSVINGQEELNQQVVYLLAIGRFYTDDKNNSTEEAAQQSQTSLAMQSFISGTLSQQINSVLGSLIKNNNWNFGTNISTGTDGFNNAEYEGLLSGSLFSNRLLINGQFGYRDNQNATSSFIGDFDVKYLLTPSGSIAIKVYNQTNDRYFTKSSLNTQGFGFIFKKDFNSWLDLFRWKKKSK